MTVHNRYELFDYQKTIGDDITKPALFLDAGLGKSLTSLRRWDKLNDFSRIPGKLLVVGLTAKKEEWRQDIMDYWWSAKDQDLKPEFKPYVSTGKKGSEYIAKNNPRIVVVNFESVWRTPSLLKWVDKDTTIIVDESQKIKIFSSKATKMLLALSDRVDKWHSLILTATPVSNRQWEHYYTQMKFIKEPHIVKMRKRDFETEFTIQAKIDFGSGFPVMQIVDYKHTDKLRRWVNGVSVFMKREAAYGAPQEELKVFSKPSKSDAYSRMEHNHMLWEDEPAKPIQVYDQIGSYYMALRQAATGTLGYVDNVKGAEVRKYTTIAQERLNHVSELLEGIGNDRVVIFYTFNAELVALKEVLIKMDRPYSEFNGHTKDLSTFEQEYLGNNLAPNNTVALVNYKSGATGINSLKLSKYAIFFSPPQSSETLIQAKARLDRIGQTSKPYFYLMYKAGTVEEATWKTVLSGEEFTAQSFRDYLLEKGLTYLDN